MPYLTTGDWVRYPNSTRLGYVTFVHEKLTVCGRKQHRAVIAFGPEECHTLVGNALKSLILVKESSRLGDLDTVDQFTKRIREGGNNA